VVGKNWEVEGTQIDLTRKKLKPLLTQFHPRVDLWDPLPDTARMSSGINPPLGITNCDRSNGIEIR
jgi:hypothetical protein